MEEFEFMADDEDDKFSRKRVCKRIVQTIESIQKTRRRFVCQEIVGVINKCLTSWKKKNNNSFVLEALESSKYIGVSLPPLPENQLLNQYEKPLSLPDIPSQIPQGPGSATTTTNTFETEENFFDQQAFFAQEEVNEEEQEINNKEDTWKSLQPECPVPLTNTSNTTSFFTSSTSLAEEKERKENLVARKLNELYGVDNFEKLLKFFTYHYCEFYSYLDNKTVFAQERQIVMFLLYMVMYMYDINLGELRKDLPKSKEYKPIKIAFERRDTFTCEPGTNVCSVITSLKTLPMETIIKAEMKSEILCYIFWMYNTGQENKLPKMSASKIIADLVSFHVSKLQNTIAVKEYLFYIRMYIRTRIKKDKEDPTSNNIPIFYRNYLNFIRPFLQTLEIGLVYRYLELSIRNIEKSPYVSSSYRHLYTTTRKDFILTERCTDFRTTAQQCLQDRSDGVYAWSDFYSVCMFLCGEDFKVLMTQETEFPEYSFHSVVTFISTSPMMHLVWSLEQYFNTSTLFTIVIPQLPDNVFVRNYDPFHNVLQAMINYMVKQVIYFYFNNIDIEEYSFQQMDSLFFDKEKSTQIIHNQFSNHEKTKIIATTFLNTLKSYHLDLRIRTVRNYTSVTTKEQIIVALQIYFTENIDHGEEMPCQVCDRIRFEPEKNELFKTVQTICLKNTKDPMEKRVLDYVLISFADNSSTLSTTLASKFEALCEANRMCGRELGRLCLYVRERFGSGEMILTPYSFDRDMIQRLVATITSVKRLRLFVENSLNLDSNSKQQDEIEQKLNTDDFFKVQNALCNKDATRLLPSGEEEMSGIRLLSLNEEERFAPLGDEEEIYDNISTTADGMAREIAETLIRIKLDNFKELKKDLLKKNNNNSDRENKNQFQQFFITIGQKIISLLSKNELLKDNIEGFTKEIEDMRLDIETVIQLSIPKQQNYDFFLMLFLRHINSHIHNIVMRMLRPYRIPLANSSTGSNDTATRATTATTQRTITTSTDASVTEHLLSGQSSSSSSSAPTNTLAENDDPKTIAPSL